MNTLLFISVSITIAGYVIGLGAVTVIDLHGFFGRKSSYWTQATIRTHKITKPLIWIGMILATIGSMLCYWNEGWTQLHIMQALIAGALFLNGLFLTFWVSPRLLLREREGRDTELLPQKWQHAITVSFVVSFVGWWSEVALFSFWITQHHIG